MTTTAPDRTRRSRWQTAGWIGLLLFGAFPVFAAVNDLIADARTGLPSDHTGTFTAVTGTAWSTAQPTARYITLLERGYALHELVFAILFLAILAVPYRQRHRWAWFACWTPTVANLGYALTFGAHDRAIGYRSLIVLIALPALLVAQAPAFFRARRGDPRAPGRPSTGVVGQEPAAGSERGA